MKGTDRWRNVPPSRRLIGKCCINFHFMGQTTSIEIMSGSRNVMPKNFLVRQWTRRIPRREMPDGGGGDGGQVRHYGERQRQNRQPNQHRQGQGHGHGKKSTKEDDQANTNGNRNSNNRQLTASQKPYSIKVWQCNY